MAKALRVPSRLKNETVVPNVVATSYVVTYAADGGMTGLHEWELEPRTFPRATRLLSVFIERDRTSGNRHRDLFQIIVKL